MKNLASKEVKIGIAFVVSLFILYFGINFLKGVNIFKPTNSYIVAFDDVTGLTLSSPVVVNGFQVGLVSSMHLDEKTNKVNVEMNLNKGVRIPKGSKVRLDVSLLGNASLMIEQNLATTEMYTTDDIIEGSRVHGAMEAVSTQMIPEFVALLPKIDSILVGVNNIVNSPALMQSVNNAEAITENIKQSTQQLNVLMASVNKDVPVITGNLKTVSNDVAAMGSKLNAMDLNSTYNSLDATLKNVEQLSVKLNQKDNSLGLLLNDRQLYDSLNVTIGNASLLLKDVKENPGKYINVKVF
ncbi:phospholipid/cholesterol/gamma-HCH transport system substrate-binding protein [Dysgonomonas sp. PH5-45]|uniref:MlaD family protein n=1 Tax=unclassified Dysgonomonas TaxID=2630389 RepID=UPI0024757AD8|nr:MULTISPECIES: MlaD family protein [unclassified Dysgonomonas]MDH6354320.1 phospholipid/cholesterol/gamma-HCH transport system substrate-binding protein [Dysgonomonas sp. PH5-45]MDH6387220.1 phospholipid/cholesterol/gamma-HCH transport system substrate-binding protein [Dysgonomonas sp. PH5-37]